MTTRLGMLTPSSNTVLETVVSSMLAPLPDVSAHFARFEVTSISLGSNALAQFELEPMLEAARLLSHARVDAIAWNGTSAGWLGLDADRELCAAIEDATGIPAVTSTLALCELLAQTSGRYALVTPYTDDVQARIIETFGRDGLECVHEEHLGLSENFTFAEVSAETIAEAVGRAAAAKPDAIATFCTNLAAAPLAASLEEAHGIAVYDTVATAVWASLRASGADVPAIHGWGRLLATA